MPSSHALATPLRAWRCPQCTRRAFSATTRSRAVGPEHPQYIEVPEAPQQTIPYHPPVKGTLPVPRNVLAGAGSKGKTSEAWLNATARRPRRQIKHRSGSREEWQAKISESRRRNLEEGIRSINTRQQREARQAETRNRIREEERIAALDAPEREDERITLPTHGLDLETLLHKVPADPNRESRLADKRANYARHNALRANARMEHLHTLYMNARTFIVNTQQLDAAVDEAFGTNEKPVRWSEYGGNGASVWDQGRPRGVADRLGQAQGSGGAAREAVKTKGDPLDLNRQRLRRIAEELTGGAME